MLAAMVAGVILGAPTLRLRGDYLAIVTLGFGEIIQLIAENSTSITNGNAASGAELGPAVLGPHGGRSTTRGRWRRCPATTCPSTT